ncbi:MAG TPA: hypothetical protein VKQ11_00365 [Candidatus Sulfotelmatobacter sp.]|nr:hypothetical protein [Candidatus Sulfotelmatobacter sp.]
MRDFVSTFLKAWALLLLCMFLAAALLVFIPIAQAATTINSISTTPTQAIVAVTRPTANPLTAIKVSEDPAFGTILDDVNPALFANADQEAAHLAVPTTVSGSNTIVILRIGLRTSQQSLTGSAPDSKWHSRALAASTHYYVTVTGDAPATGEFVTATTAGIAPEGPPLDPNGFGQMGNCEYTDFSKPCIEPHTGQKIYSTDPNAWGSSAIVPIKPLWYSGGTGWTNLSNIAAYSGAGATTGNTNTVCVYLGVDGSVYNNSATFGATAGYWPYNNLTDLALDLYGAGSDASGTNRTVQGALSLDSCQTAYTPAQTVALPHTAQAASGTLPSTYPSAYFASWGGKALPRAAMPHQGYVTASAGVVTLTDTVSDAFGHSIPIGNTAQSVNAYFDKDWVAGTKLLIPGGSANSGGACVNDFCTIASVQNGTHLTLVENLTIGVGSTGCSVSSSGSTGCYYHSAGLAAILQKTNATGTITFSARWKVAQSYPQDIWTGGHAIVPVTASDGCTGYPAIFPSNRQEVGALYLSCTSGTNSPSLRLISQFPNNGCTNGSSNDCPSGAIQNLGPTTPQFDPVDPSLMYVTKPTNGGHTGLFKVKYNATGTSCGGSACGWLPWTHWNTPYSSTTIAAPVTNELTWTNLTPFVGGQDLRSQILANTNYSETLWGPLTGFNTAGLAGPFMILYVLSGGQNVTGWMFAFCTSSAGVCSGPGPGGFYKAWRTDDSTAGGTDVSNGALRYSGIHAITPLFGSTVANGSAFLLSTHTLNAGTSTILNSGPYTGTITAVSRGGVFSSNTALPWPIDGTYDNTCPGGLPAWVVARGAVGNQCVLVQGQLPCNTFAGAAEAAAQPCPYNSSWGYISAAGGTSGLEVGDFGKDNSGDAGGFGGEDDEGFMVVTTPTLVSGSTYQWYMQRNANFSYCAFGNAQSVPPKDGIQSAAQLQHANGWGYHMVPRDGCAGGSALLVDIAGNNGYAYNFNLITGHFDATNVGPQATSIIGAGAQLPDFSFIYNIQSQFPWSSIPNPRSSYQIQGPKFAGYNSDLAIQSYSNTNQAAASALLKQYAFDFSTFNAATGGDLESPGQTIGSPFGASLQGGTTGVYSLTISGTPDIKHQNLNVWVGRRMLIDISSPTLGNTITDANAYRYCYAYKAGECRIGSAQGTLYVAVPYLDVVDSPTQCWASQMNLNIPCAFAGPTEGGQGRQVYMGSSDGAAARQRYLGWLGMGPGQQQVYSKILPTPDGLFGLFGSYVTNGYDTTLKMVQLPPPANDSVSRSTFVPVSVQCPTGSTCIAEFGYDETGYDHANKFYCTTRAENCRVVSPTINEASPFSFPFPTDAALTPVSGSILIPALPGHVLYYRLIIGGNPGPTQVVAVQ